MAKPAWDSFATEVLKKKYILTVRELDALLKKEGHKGLSQ